ncbi:hypothetical protein TNIN_442961 [Trichonephila inaurata madagascariensis]|uniref:Uncharacterized protein n=1 Tax=Trichonephila inaurata madagascariensis TaxID=2747483 RepID=A0A8X7C3C7_9ARAC|nr:hypothetical protein TNIN_291021 [Trichonephila inaurata madagascariensis]GFY54607.1 hypothetical protein TNIN_442961 [Trichonephila inaurata madagascariensis]
MQSQQASVEFLTALMGARLQRYFCAETNIQPSNITLWSDSQVVLGWIRSDLHFRTFVCNRIMKFYSTLPQHSVCISQEFRIQQSIFHEAFF